MNGIDWNIFSSLDALNSEFNSFLTEKYINGTHSALGTTPRERYLKDSQRIKFIPIEKLEEHFLHRETRRVYNDATIKINNIQFEVPQKYIGQKLFVRFLPDNLDKAYIFNQNNQLTETIYPLKKVENSKIKRNGIDFTKLNGGNTNV